MKIAFLSIQILTAIVGCLATLISVPLFFAFRWPAATMWVLKVYISALSFVFVLVGVLTTVVGIFANSVFISLLGLYIVVVYTVHIISVTRPPDGRTGFERAFGFDWMKAILSEQMRYFLSKRTSFLLPSVPKARLEQNICFATFADTDRQFLCDIWQPSEGIRPSGVAYIYLHGSAFYFLDKDYGTRPFFSHLAAQGHVIMDVAYRLAPETDIKGMIHDVKRAIIWMKEHADVYNIDPARIIVSGGSAGAHLALMAAYTCDNPLLTPLELKGKDQSVCAVISLYGPTDLASLYYHTKQELTTRLITGKNKKFERAKSLKWLLKSAGKDYHRLGFDKGFENVGTLAPILGGHPDEYPERYALYSPLFHVHSECPPTLLIHGEHDIMAPVSNARSMYKLLKEVGVPAVLHILPQTDHAFDLILPKISPSTHNALYDVERFIAFMAARNITEEKEQQRANLNLFYIS